jgi:thiol-disulfide isomerase/thioredoxin
MNKTSFYVFLFSIAFVLQTLNAQNVFKAQKKLIGTKIENIQFSDYYPDSSIVDNINSKFKVLEFWASWCKPCLKAVPHLNDLSKKFEGESDLFFISVGYENQVTIEKVLKKVDFETIVVSDQTRKIHNDLNIEFKGTMVIPRTVLVDDKNEIIWYGTPNELDEELIGRFLNREKNL